MREVVGVEGQMLGNILHCDQSTTGMITANAVEASRLEDIDLETVGTVPGHVH